MPLIPVNEVGQVGVISDKKPHELPLNIWSAAKNVRFRNGFVEKFLGEERVFGTLGNAPYFIAPVKNGSSYYWIEAGLTKVYAWNGAIHTDITRAVGGDYGATALRNWTGVSFGGIFVLNNGLDIPQQWVPPSVAVPLAALANWNANHTCGAMREFRRHLVALDVTKSGIRYPQMVKWSHPADSGAVPSSWDETDDTKDAGEYELLGSTGFVIDAAKLRDSLCIYKEDSVHLMRYVGGTAVMRFDQLFDSFGVFTRRCAVEYAAGKHAVLASGDLIAHDGVTWESIVDRRLRDWIFNQIDPTNYPTSFVVRVPGRYEVWFCIPTIGNTLPNLAIVWNWKDGTLGFRDLNGVAHAAIGLVDTTVPETWDSDTDVWDSDSTTWGEVGFNPSGTKVLLASPGTPKLLLADSKQTFDAVAFNAYVERTGLPLPVTPDGPPDMTSMKFLKDLWPRIEGTLGASIQISVGVQQAIGGTVNWGSPQNYVIGTTQHVDVRKAGRLFALKVESTADVDWRLHGYQADVKRIGKF